MEPGMRTKTPATIEDLHRVPGKAEIVNGEIVPMPPTGDSPARAGLRISHRLIDYEERTGLGQTYPDNATFIVNLPNRTSFSPDVAFVKGKANEEVNMDFIEGAPTFAVDVRSKNDYGRAAERAMAAKRADYFAAGTQVVWDVDLLGEDVVRVYRR